MFKKTHHIQSTEAVQPSYPMRINRYMALKGIETRTGSDVLISSGKVTINGRKAVLGDKVNEGDEVKVVGKTMKNDYMYFAYNKPKGVVSTNPQKGERAIMDDVTMQRLPVKVFPIGRLDKDSHGLILLTNDGRITDRLLNPIYSHEKEYVVEVDHKYTPAFLLHMQNGVDIGGYTTKPAKVERVTETIFKITLTEGKNRQIRRMTEKLGYTVVDLCRVRVQNITLGQLKTKSWREISGDERKVFLQSIGL